MQADGSGELTISEDGGGPSAASGDNSTPQLNTAARGRRTPRAAPPNAVRVGCLRQPYAGSHIRMHAGAPPLGSFKTAFVMAVS